MRPVLEPCLEHENTPQCAGMVLRSRHVLSPLLVDGRISEISFSIQPFSIQKFLCPVAERTSEPLADWYGEAGFWTVHEGTRHMPVQNLAQDPFTAAIAHFHYQRQFPGKLNYSPVQE